GVLVVIACATRLPLVPLHGWAREALAEAPVGVVVLLAGVMSRSGGYVLIRLLDATLHDATWLLAPFLAALAGVTALWAALAAFRARDVRVLGAYLAMVPGAVTVLGAGGVTPLSLDGAALSLFAGGLASALVAGACAEVGERSQSRDLALVGGLAGRTPRLTWVVVLAGLGVVGLPLTGTFVAELVVCCGSFQGATLGAFGVAAGLLAAAAAVGWMLHRLVFGAPHPELPPPVDL